VTSATFPVRDWVISVSFGWFRLFFVTPND
jgi:hypothetical protein